jgi:hypothetical protein
MLNTLNTGKYDHFQESSCAADMTFYLLHFYCLISQQHDNIFLVPPVKFSEMFVENFMVDRGITY